jgi:hypothetical protein
MVTLAACKTASVDKPAPAPPSASPTSAAIPLPASAPAPVTGAPTTAPPSSGSPAPAPGTAKTDGKSSGTEGNPQTSEERRVAVAHRLDESLGTFDATLRKEQSDLAKAREQRADDAAKTADAKGGEGVDDVKADAGVDPDKDAAHDERHGGMKSEADAKKDSKGSSEDNGAAHTGDVGEGRVDDIVGRQICEAAQRETDPELKEKLMKECQEYRDSSH